MLCLVIRLGGLFWIAFCLSYDLQHLAWFCERNFMVNIARKLLMICVLGFAFVLPSKAGSIIGDTFQIDWLYPNSGSVFESTSGTVTAGGLSWNPAFGLSLVM